ncbi:hypothetical protein N9J72_02540 [Candidatus Gracilibacteria bacterium]|nr:hypothetical protein [Candidatus Gracilibacteria bacterium]
MKDIFTTYKKHQLQKHAGIFALSLVLALSINMFLFDNRTGEYLKANVLEGGASQTVKADTEIVSNGPQLRFVNNKDMSGVTEISFSMSYNPELGKPADAEVLVDDGIITEISNHDGISTYVVRFMQDKDIMADSSIASFVFEKQKDETVHVNVTNVNFTDKSGEIYLLSSSGTMF